MTGVLRDSRSLATDLYRVSQSEKQKGPLRSVLCSMSGTDAAVSGVTSICMLGTKSSKSSPFSSSRASSSALEHKRMLEFPKMAAAGMQGTLLMSWPIWASPAVLLSGVFPFSKMESSCGESGGSCSIVSTSSSLSSPSSSSPLPSSSEESLQDGWWEAKTCSSLSFSFSRLAISVSRVDFSSSKVSVSWGKEGEREKKRAWAKHKKTLNKTKKTMWLYRSASLLWTETLFIFGSMHILWEWILYNDLTKHYLQLEGSLSAPSACYDTWLPQFCSSPSWSSSFPPPLWKAKINQK